MITYLPQAIVAAHVAGYTCGSPHDHLPLYEHFARKLLAWNLPRELLIDTSGINYTELGPLPSQAAAATALAKLFVAAGTDTPRGGFLRRCGLRRWADLTRPIPVRGRQCSATINYDVRERRLREPGPNCCHPGAVYAQTAHLQFGWDRRWRFVLWYGYSHGGSSWQIAVRQAREALSTFVNATVPRWLDATLMPEPWAPPRQQRNREHDRLTKSVDEVFGWDCYGPSPGTITTDTLVLALLDGRKPRLTKRRLGVLQKWMQADREFPTRKEKTT